MIEIFTGIPGSGKSLCAVERALKYLARGGQVATNIELRPAGIRRYLRKKGYYLNYDQLIDLDTFDKALMPHRHIPKGTKEVPNLIILDECAILFPSREYQKTPKEFFKFCLMIRRAHTDLILICQRMNQIDKQFRNLAQYRINHVNLKRAFRMPLVGAFPFEVILKAQFDQGDHYQYFTTTVLRKEVFSCYHTLQEVVKFDRKTKKKLQRKKRYVTLVGRYRYYRFCAKRLYWQAQKTANIWHERITRKARNEKAEKNHESKREEKRSGKNT